MKFLSIVLILFTVGFSSTKAQLPSKIAFGSCSHQDKPQPILKTAMGASPDVFIYLGDNIYGDTENMQELQAKYDKLGMKPEFKELKEKCRILATWDDHDYGANDAGLEYPKKEESKALFLKFWEEPTNSERYKHKGIYHSEFYENGDKRLQIILLDTRTFRDSLKSSNKKKPYKNDYQPDFDSTKTLLGKQQWAWLKWQLLQPADLRIIASSTQFGIEYNGWEAWANLPLEQKKMLKLINETQANGVIFISGDVHWAELSRLKNPYTYPIYDCTSSGITQTWPTVEPNKNRIQDVFRKVNFGTIEINWQAENPQITFKIIDVKGKVQIEQQIGLNELSFETR